MAGGDQTLDHFPDLGGGGGDNVGTRLQTDDVEDRCPGGPAGTGTDDWLRH
ncbi:hypothetical protein SSP35_02_03350 [Streptomyces sp. NBRC 110611]|nr:hypothetical protein SSP35_02_03350 [Streptomyces sp. NBRC 110611]